MKTEQLMHFAVEDGDISCHVTCTKYEGGAGTTFRVSSHSSFPDEKYNGALEVEKFSNASDALNFAEQLRALFRVNVLKHM